jgi:hypothetical protein
MERMVTSYQEKLDTVTNSYQEKVNILENKLVDKDIERSPNYGAATANSPRGNNGVHYSQGK